MSVGTASSSAVPPRVRITGVGVEMPTSVVSTADVEEQVDIHRLGFPAGWLERVTGVRERRWAEPHVQPSDLAARAARRALADAEADPATVDAVIFAGITRDFIEPATANVVQAAIGATNARVFDVTNACNGLMDGLDVADSLIRTGKAGRALVVAGERASISINWRIRTPEELLRSAAGLVVSDGGGALLVEQSDDPERGLLTREFRSDGSHWQLATGGRFRPTTSACELCGSVVDLPFLCDGRSLFAVGVQLMPVTMGAAMERAGWRYEDIDLVFCHEASRRFVTEGMAVVGEGRHPGPKIWSTVERYGNTTTVSLALGLSEARSAGALTPGAKVLLLGGAAGVSMAAVTMVW